MLEFSHFNVVYSDDCDNETDANIKMYSLESVLRFADNSAFFEKLQIKVASSHIIPGFTCSLYTAYLLLVLLKSVSEFWMSFAIDSKVFFSFFSPQKTNNHQAT